MDCINQFSAKNPVKTETQTAFLEALQKTHIHGSIETEGHVNYVIHTTPWNLRCQPKPLALVYANTADDVAAVVKLAAQYGIPIQPRSGGHSYASYSLGGTSGSLVVDLAAMDKVVVDQKTWRATIGPGTRLKGVTDGLLKQGKRTIAHGVGLQVGMGGHATVGGQGPLARMYGLTIDHVVEMEVVLADGSIVRASATENSDLFWALRGAGASFGIVTSFTVITHPISTSVTHYSFQLTIGSPNDAATPAKLAAFFMKWQEFISSPVVLADRTFNSTIVIMNWAVLIQGTRFGTKAELEESEVMVLMNKHFENIDLKCRELDWVASGVAWETDVVYQVTGSLPIPMYMKSLSVRKDKLLTQEAITRWFEYLHKHAPGDTVWVILGDLEGGAISDVANDATAYAQRDSLFALTVYSIAKLPFPDDVLAFLNGMIDTVNNAMPDGNFGVYPGYVDPLIPKSEWPTRYWGANYPRLLKIKEKYDPNNVFANPQSVGNHLVSREGTMSAMHITPVA
ncbi:Glucooligosaccharide oxidase [Piloderma croceum F 1598]|uniref:Glucooligosaccharide oxidase n=1 Tax=Piloderma croceum (strain F 1598) TaxID=765440 RepID=A0A0C3F0F0_PILCF|nr:Glucooligosaccharide oxidase [Piloderma croceum F 1598]